MLELYMKLFEARSVNFEAKGGGSGIWRDEVLGAAAVATKKHPLGNRVVLAEMGDQHSLKTMASTIACFTKSHRDELFAVVMGRPIPEQLEKLVYKSPRYKRESRRAAVVRKKSENLLQAGKINQAAEKKIEANTIIENAKNRVREEVLRTGKCPACRGAGVYQRKTDTCTCCLGAGNAYADLTLLKKKMPADEYTRFVKLAEKIAIERQEWINEFLRQINREKAA